MEKKPNVLFLPVRSPTLSPQEWVDRINNNVFPNDDWNVYVLLRKPMLMGGYKKNITPINMYSDFVYKRKLTDKETGEAERWLGQSFNTIIYMEDLKYHTKYKPKRKDRENIAKHVMFFRKFLEKKKIDFACICFPNEIVNITMHYVLKKMGIPFWNLIKFHKGPRTRDERLFDLIIDALPAKLNKLSYEKKEIDKVYQEQRNALLKRKAVLGSYVKKRSQQNFSLSLKTIKTKIRQLKGVIKHRSKFESTFRISDLTIIYLKNFINRILNSYIFGWLLFSKVPESPFFYFPLHFTRDYQISFREPFLDQVELIEKISKALPHNTKLVVKSHPHFIGSDVSFCEFKKIKRNPNVVLVHYNENSLNLIQKSLGVITINSSAGYEAVIINKPLTTFGNEFYSKEGVAVMIKDTKNLPKTLLNVKNNPDYMIDVNERKKMVYEYHKNAFPLNIRQFVDKTLSEEDKKMVIAKYRQLEKFLMGKRR